MCGPKQKQTQIMLAWVLYIYAVEYFRAEKDTIRYSQQNKTIHRDYKNQNKSGPKKHLISGRQH